MSLTTDDDRDLCRVIAGYIEDNGMPPTIREIALALGLTEKSTATVTYRLRRAEANGYLMRKDMRARGIRLTDDGRALIEAQP